MAKRAPQTEERAPVKDHTAPVRAGKKFATKLELHMIQTVAAGIRANLPMAALPGLIGVTKSTFQHWRDLGEREDADELHALFATTVEIERAKRTGEIMTSLAEMSRHDFKALKMYAEVMDPDIFQLATKAKVEAEVKVERAEADLSCLSDEELLTHMALQAKIKAASTK